MARIDLLEVPLGALKDGASQLEQIIPEASRPITSHSVSALWHRWTRLHAVSRAQERALEDTVREWRSFTEKVGKSVWICQSMVVHGSPIPMHIPCPQKPFSTVSQSIASARPTLVETLMIMWFPVNR